MSARQGKIAQLPLALREEINRRIEDGKTGRDILRWLNAHPTVTQLIQPDAEGLFITDQNFSNWRAGGYADWQRRREHVNELRELSQFSIQLAQASGGNLTEGAAAILAGKILELLEGINKTMAAAKEVDEVPDAAAIASLSESLSSLSDSLASLRTGDQNNRRLAQNEERLRLLQERLKQTQETLELEKKKFQRTTCELFLKWFDDARVKGVLAADDSTDAKTDKLGQIIFGSDWK